MALMGLVSWLSLVVGWLLVWRGDGLVGCVFIGLFAFLQWSRKRRKETDEKLEAEMKRQRPVWSSPQSVTGSALELPADRSSGSDAESGDMESSSNLPHPVTADSCSDTPARWLKLVWASYGNASLQGRISLLDWYRHHLTWGAACLFRDAVSGELLAGNGFEWLSWLHRRGATRLSIEMRPGIAGIGRANDLDEQVIVCHFQNSREVWAVGEEVSQARRQARELDWEVRTEAFPLYGCGSYLPYVHTYWRIEADSTTVDWLPIDWMQTRESVEEALQGARFFSHLQGKQRYLFHMGSSNDPEWSRFPVLPDDPALPIPHELLLHLTSYKGHWDNECHPKNENGAYAQAQGDERILQKLEAHRNLISSLIGHVQCLAGSETRWKPRLRPSP